MAEPVVLIQLFLSEDLGESFDLGVGDAEEEGGVLLVGEGGGELEEGLLVLHPDASEHGLVQGFGEGGGLEIEVVFALEPVEARGDLEGGQGLQSVSVQDHL